MTNSLGPNVDWDTALLIGRCISGLCWPASNGLIMHYSSIGGPAACSAYCRYWKHLSGPFIKVKSPRPIRSLACQWTSWFCFLAADTEGTGGDGQLRLALALFWAARKTRGHSGQVGAFPRQQGGWQSEFVPGTGVVFFGGRLWIFVFHDDLFWGRSREAVFVRSKLWWMLTKTDDPGGGGAAEEWLTSSTRIFC